MTDANDLKRDSMTKADLLAAMSLLLTEFESHPGNKDTFSLQVAFEDDGRWVHNWDNGAFTLDIPDLPGDDN
jgi:hypothetical protein